MSIPRWAHLLFGTLEPLVNVATAVFITCNAALFNQLLFAAAPSGSEVDLALARMYASVLLCFGLCQYCAWSTWAADENSKPRVRAWTLMMLVPDAHHLAFAYGLYLRGPHGRYDAAFVAHYAIQGALTIARLALLASTAAGTLTGTGPVGSAIQGSLDAIFSPRVDRSLPADLRLDGVTVAITGASRGLGLAVAKAVARRGATVVALNRTLVAETEALLKAEGAASATTAVAVDLESVASVDAAVAELKRRRITVDRLVLNAGMLPIASRPSKDGADVMLQVNVLSSARLIEMMRGSGVLSQTRAADGGLPRIVFVGSEAHRSSAPLNLDDLAEDAPLWEYGVGGVVKFYGHTKLYLHTWAAQLARELEGKADVLHLCPGAVASNIGREGPWWCQPFLKGLMWLTFQPPATAAVPVVWCAAHPEAAGRNGLYLHLGRERAAGALATDPETGKQLWEAVRLLLKRLEKKSK